MNKKERKSKSTRKASKVDAQNTTEEADQLPSDNEEVRAPNVTQDEGTEVAHI